MALTLFQHLIDGFHNRDLRNMVADLLNVTTEQYTASQMTYDLRRLRLKGLIFRPPRTNRYFVTPYWLEGGPALLPAGGACLPTRHGDVYRHRRRATFPSPPSPGACRLTTRPADLRRFSAFKNKLKNLTL